MNDTRAEYLCGRLDFWDSLSERQQSRLLDGTTISRYKKGSVIHNGVGDLGLIFVRRGRVCVYTVSEEGREFCCCGFCGRLLRLAAHGEHRLSVRKRRDRGRPHDNRLAGNQGHCKTSIKAESFAARQCGISVTWYQHAEHASGQRRAQNWPTYAESDRMGTARIRQHEQIARYVGTAREVVSRTLGRLASSGALELERGVIIIRDKSKLRKLM